MMTVVVVAFVAVVDVVAFVVVVFVVVTTHSPQIPVNPGTNPTHPHTSPAPAPTAPTQQRASEHRSVWTEQTQTPQTLSPYPVVISSNPPAYREQKRRVGIEPPDPG